MKEADVVNFQIIYDQRNNLTQENNEKCVGLFAESTYPYFPIQFINKSAIEIAKELTERIKKTNSIDSEDYKRFRVEYYYIHKELYFIDYTLAASNIGKFKSMEDLTHNLKEKFIDFYFLAGSRTPLPYNIGCTSIHMFSLFDGSCNLTLHFPYSVVPSIYVLKLLNKMKEIMLN